MHKPGYIGVDKDSYKRIWGYIPDPTDYRRVYAFWGFKTSTLKFAATKNDTIFFKNVKKKRKMYIDITNTDFSGNVVDQFSQYLLIKKLKNG